MTLLEVVLALVIFLVAILAIGQLFNTATGQAVDIQLQSQATRLAQSKLAEYISGVRSLTTAGSGTFDDEQDPDANGKPTSSWEWQCDVEADGTAAESLPRHHHRQPRCPVEGKRADHPEPMGVRPFPEGIYPGGGNHIVQ